MVIRTRVRRILARCYRRFGSQVAFAHALHVTPQALTKWNNDGRIPLARVPQIVALMHGTVTYHDLRPDLFEKNFGVVHGVPRSAVTELQPSGGGAQSAARRTTTRAKRRDGKGFVSGRGHCLPTATRRHPVSPAITNKAIA